MGSAIGAGADAEVAPGQGTVIVFVSVIVEGVATGVNPEVISEDPTVP
jgi:hypothetical protein